MARPFVIPSRAKKIESIEKRWENCDRCDLFSSRTQVVTGDGNPSSRVLVIGEAPGENEDKKGKPFVGKAGAILNRFMREAGLTRADLYIANVVGCRPWFYNPATGYPKNRPPEPSEIAACSPRLQEIFLAVDPVVLVLAGRSAQNSLFPFGGAPSRIHDCLIFSVTHPAAFLYGDGKRDESQEINRWREISEAIKSAETGKPSGVDWKLVLKGQLIVNSAVYSKEEKK